ncbi:MAG: DUF2911 domain-containing protein [Cytophagales bacterium]|nr:MAG: DUF2911 domain-containing protein [Cytophagales bacterium]
MIRRILIITGIVISVLIVLFYVLRTYTKSHSPATEAKIKFKDTEISVKYCQPAKKGREIFGKLVPYGKVWRTGANEATEITFSTDVIINNDKELKAGTYTLFTIPDEKQWIIIFNGVLGQWGHFTYDESKDVARTQAKVEAIENVKENLTIDLQAGTEEANMLIMWDKTQVKVSIKPKK